MSDRITKQQIQKRIEELREAQREAVTRLTAINTAMAELQNLINPVVTTSGEELGQQEP